MSEERNPAKIVATWPFALKAVDESVDHLSNGGLSALEAGINILEKDESCGCYYVGKGGPGNSDGYLEQDAALMEGRSLSFGSVTALKGIDAPISVARRVMERSPHSMLTGDGALKFAEENGFQKDPQMMERRQGNQRPECEGHDTVGMLLRDKDGSFYAGVSTTGPKNKHPGRVGDSALPGCGLYADDEGGAACCSGDGDQMLKFCPAFQIVNLMKMNYSAQEACSSVLSGILKRRNNDWFEMVAIAIDKQGGIGAVSTIDSWTDPRDGQSFSGFPYVVWQSGMERSETKVKEKMTIDSKS